MYWTLYNGDASIELQKIQSNTIDLIITSPPYADARKSTYGGIAPDKYVQWFLPISEELFRVLKSDGSFILNIKEKVENGERSTYVINLILALRAQGWLWTEEYIWHKKNCFPGKWPNRFRDAWERCLHFTKSRKFNMYQEAVMEDAAPATLKQGQNLKGNDLIRKESATGSHNGRNISNCIRPKVYPSNVLHLATECGNKNHSAAFPEALPEFFIKLFTKESDLVLDPFMGSGTSGISAIKNKRRFQGIELKEDYYKYAESKIKELK